MIGDLYIIKIHILDSKFDLEHSNKSNNSEAEKIKIKAIKTKERKCKVEYIFTDFIELF